MKSVLAALCVSLVLGTAALAAHHHRRLPVARTLYIDPPGDPASDHDPARTGGGSQGYNWSVHENKGH